MARLHRVKRIEHESEVPLHDHLDELRNRLIISILALVVGFVVAFWRRDDILELLNRQLPDEVDKPITLGVTEPLKIAIMISIWSALIVALPVLFYQLYAFVVPAFSQEAQGHIWPMLVVVPLLFIGGVVFAYFLMLPVSTNFLLSFDADQYQVEVRARDYYGYAVMLMGGVGLIFEMPAAVWMLTKVGVLSSRLLRRSRRYAIFVLAVVAAALPGGDPISMMLCMIPLLLLYEASILVARAVERGRAESVPDPRQRHVGRMLTVHAADWVVPVVAPALRDGAVAVDDAGAIVEVAPREAILGRHPSAAVVEHGAAAILPGFVNAHTHLEYAVYGGFGDAMPFAPWLADHIRRKRALDEDAVLASVTLGAEACLRTGVTCVGDCAFAGATVEALRVTGLRGTVYLEAFGAKGADPAAVAGDAARRLDGLGSAGGPLARLGLSPHAPYSVAPPVYAALLRLARERGLPVATHLAESAAELEALTAGTGPVIEAGRGLFEVNVLGEHPIARLARDGSLGPDVLVIHAVHVGPEEIALLAASGSPVAHCPRSNAVLGCGVAPLGALRAAGVTVGLGTDSPSSAIDLDVFAELRTAIMMARAATGQADALTPKEALALATVDAARALGRDGEVGGLAPGLRADLVICELADGPYWPVEEVETAVVYGGSPERVAMTLVDGTLRYRKDDDARYRHALTRAARARAAMISQSGTTPP